MRKMRKYVITLLAGLAAAALIMFSTDIFAQTEAVVVYHILCDAFFAVGVVITAIGLLVFSANEGTFDIIVYGVNSFFDMFRKVSRKKYDTFYDYRVSREEKKLSFGFLVICGVLFLAISLVMYMLYCRCL